MSVAYLVLAHENPRHFARLLSALASPTAAFFVHIDKKSQVEFTHDLSADTVRFSTHRSRVHWGDFSMVEATLALLSEALRDPRHFDRLVLLSGTDYPIRSASYIESVFALHRETEFISMVRMPSEAADKPLSRLTRYRPSPDETLVESIIGRALRKARLAPRERDFKKVLGELAPYAGWQWWALTRGACEYIEHFCAANPKIVNFFRNTHIPDEMFFQTIIANSPYKNRVSRNLTFADWTAGGRSPARLSNEHVHGFASVTRFGSHDVYGDGEILFARKLSDESQDVVAALDRLIQERDG